MPMGLLGLYAVFKLRLKNKNKDDLCVWPTETSKVSDPLELELLDVVSCPSVSS